MRGEGQTGVSLTSVEEALFSALGGKRQQALKSEQVVS